VFVFKDREWKMENGRWKKAGESDAVKKGL
jgi:hypothetical protein